jgi:peptidoglycan/LPS O-acetylase OafA/YrhL
MASRVMQSWFLRHVGLLSYSLYLFHLPVIGCLEPYGLKGAALFIATFAVSYLIALTTYIFVEKPFLMLKPKSGPPTELSGLSTPLEPQYSPR